MRSGGAVLRALERDKSNHALGHSISTRRLKLQFTDFGSGSNSDSSDEEAEYQEKPVGIALLKASTNRLMNITRAFRAPRVTQEHTERFGNWFEKNGSKEEVVFIGTVLGSAPLMKKSGKALRNFHEQFHAAACSDSTDRSRLVDAAAQGIHRMKVWTSQVCYREYLRPNQKASQVLERKYESLKSQFRETRISYMTELSALRDRVTLRGDPLSADLDEIVEVKHFWDPVGMLDPKELKFLMQAVNEKVKMIFEHNPTVSKVIDFGQIERLKQMVESNEVTELRQALARNQKTLSDANMENENLKKKMGKLMNPGGEACHDAVAHALLEKMDEQIEDLRNKLWDSTRKIADLTKQEEALVLELKELRKAYEDEQTERVGVQQMFQKTSALYRDTVDQRELDRRKCEDLESHLKRSDSEVEAARRTVTRFRKFNSKKKNGGELEFQGAALVNLGGSPAPIEEEQPAEEPGPEASKRPSGCEKKLYALLDEAEDERQLAVQEKHKLVKENTDLIHQCEELQLQLNELIHDVTVMEADAVLEDVEGVVEAVDIFTQLDNLEDDYGNVIEADISGVAKDYRQCISCGNTFMCDAKFCRNCGAVRPAFGEPGKVPVIPEPEVLETPRADLKSPVLGEGLPDAITEATRKMITAADLTAKLIAIGSDLESAAAELRAELQAGTSVTPSEQAVWEKRVVQKQLKVSELQRDKSKTEALLMVAQVKETLKQSKANQLMAEVEGTTCTCTVCGCQQEKDAMRAALKGIERLCAELTSKYHASATENSVLHNSLNKVQTQLNTVANIMKNSKHLATDSSLRDCLQQIEQTGRETVFDRLWADAQSKQTRRARRLQQIVKSSPQGMHIFDVNSAACMGANGMFPSMSTSERFSKRRSLAFARGCGRPAPTQEEIENSNKWLTVTKVAVTSSRVADQFSKSLSPTYMSRHDDSGIAKDNRSSSPTPKDTSSLSETSQGMRSPPALASFSSFPDDSLKLSPPNWHHSSSPGRRNSRPPGGSPHAPALAPLDSIPQLGVNSDALTRSALSSTCTHRRRPSGRPSAPAHKHGSDHSSNDSGANRFVTMSFQGEETHGGASSSGAPEGANTEDGLQSSGLSSWNRGRGGARQQSFNTGGQSNRSMPRGGPPQQSTTHSINEPDAEIELDRISELAKGVHSIEAAPPMLTERLPNIPQNMEHSSAGETSPLHSAPVTPELLEAHEKDPFPERGWVQSGQALPNVQAKPRSLERQRASISTVPASEFGFTSGGAISRSGKAANGSVFTHKSSSHRITSTPGALTQVQPLSHGIGAGSLPVPPLPKESGHRSRPQGRAPSLSPAPSSFGGTSLMVVGRQNS